MDINAGVGGQRFKLFDDRHKYILSLPQLFATHRVNNAENCGKFLFCPDDSMKTEYITDPLRAAEFIKNGGIAAFPTETVYGLGANVFDAQAVAKIFEAKKRPADNPLIAHVSDGIEIQKLTSDLNKTATRFIDAFFPGPLTIVVKKSNEVPFIATAGLDTIGIRMPSLPLTQEFLRACSTPVVAPSANISGKPSPTTWKAVAEDLDGRIDCILQGESTQIGLESTVVDCTAEIPVLLRKGAISLNELQKIVPTTVQYSANSNHILRSPGLRHKHYSPVAMVVLIDRSLDIQQGMRIAYIGLQEPPADRIFRQIRVCGSVDEYAHALFEFFRVCDRAMVQTIYCQTIDETNIGAALMDRLRRASEG